MSKILACCLIVYVFAFGTATAATSHAPRPKPLTMAQVKSLYRQHCAMISSPLQQSVDCNTLAHYIASRGKVVPICDCLHTKIGYIAKKIFGVCAQIGCMTHS